MAVTHEHQARWSLSGSSPWTVCCPREVGSAHYHRRYVLGTTEPKTTPSGLTKISPVLPFKQSEIGQIETGLFFFSFSFFFFFFLSFFFRRSGCMWLLSLHMTAWLWSDRPFPGSPTNNICDHLSVASLALVTEQCKL